MVGNGYGEVRNPNLIIAHTQRALAKAASYENVCNAWWCYLNDLASVHDNKASRESVGASKEAR
jgi:hypothetical protein